MCCFMDFHGFPWIFMDFLDFLEVFGLKSRARYLTLSFLMFVFQAKIIGYYVGALPPRLQPSSL